jgi:hypothetical protein
MGGRVEKPRFFRLPLSTARPLRSGATHSSPDTPEVCAVRASCPMKRLALALILWPLILTSGCRSSSQPRSCLVNQDCNQGQNGQYEYCDGQAVLVSSFYYDNFFCYHTPLGTCKPMDNSTLGAHCGTNYDCKAYPTSCVNQSCVNTVCESFGGEPGLGDDSDPCPSPDALPPNVGCFQCPAGCRAGKRNWTCRNECFCPSCPAPDAAADAVDARRTSGGDGNSADSPTDMAAD